jgi:hypothetical protein
VVAALQMVAFPGRFGGDPPMLGPQENVRWDLAQRWVETGRPIRELVVPERTPTDVVPALAPRDAAVQDGAVVPKDFPLAVGLTSLLVLVDPRLALSLSGLSGLALLAVVAALARRLGGPWSGVLAAGVLATTAAFAAGTVGLLNTGATAALAVVGGVLFLVPAHGRTGFPTEDPPRAAHPRRDVASGLAFGTALALHHDLVLLVAGLVLAFTVRSPHRWLRTAWIGSGALIAVVPTLAYYAWMHGSPFVTGYAVGADGLPVADGQFLAVFTLEPSMLLEHVRRYCVRPEVGCLVGSALLSARWVPQRAVRMLALGVLLGGVPFLVFAGARPLYGVDEFSVGASFLRYALPVVALSTCICAAGPLEGPSVSGRTRLAALAAAGVIGAVLVLQAPGGVLDQRRHVLESTALRAAVLATVEADAVVVTTHGDKLLWPQRSTVTATYLVRDPDEGFRRGSTLYDVVPRPHRLADVAARSVAAGLRVYVLADTLPPDLRGLDEQLRRAGVQRERTAVPSLSQITAVAPRDS